LISFCTGLGKHFGSRALSVSTFEAMPDVKTSVQRVMHGVKTMAMLFCYRVE
jgi:hypothetical protein